MYPKHIEGTWQFSGYWFGSYRLVSEDVALRPTPFDKRGPACPVCEYPDTIQLDPRRAEFPAMTYCQECGIIFAWYVAKCPDCDGPMVNITRQKDGTVGEKCLEGFLICDSCGMKWDIESIKEINTDPDFHSEGEE